MMIVKPFRWCHVRLAFLVDKKDCLSFSLSLAKKWYELIESFKNHFFPKKSFCLLKKANVFLSLLMSPFNNKKKNVFLSLYLSLLTTQEEQQKKKVFLSLFLSLFNKKCLSLEFFKKVFLSLFNNTCMSF